MWVKHIWSNNIFSYIQLFFLVSYIQLFLLLLPLLLLFYYYNYCGVTDSKGLANVPLSSGGSGAGVDSK